MKLFLKKAKQIKGVDFEQSKGNLFEYIETAKLNKNLANNGIHRTYETTDAKKIWGGIGAPHAPDDVRGFENSKLISRAQAKVNNNPGNTAGSDKGITNIKYKGMQRVVAKDKYDDVLKSLDEKYSKGEISKSAYNDAKSNVRMGLTDDKSGISSGGTIIKELAKARENPNGYTNDFMLSQYKKEIVTTSVNMAEASMVITGIVKATTNLFQVFQNRKELNEAIKDTSIETIKSGIRGGVTGTLSSTLRIIGKKANIPVITDGTASTVIAAGMIDCGVSIYEYAKGEITAKELTESLENTGIKSVATIYFTKSLELMLGTANPFIPMAIYTIASFVVTGTREIIENAKLKEMEYNRVASLYNEAANQMISYRNVIKGQLNDYVQSEKHMLDSFIDKYEYNMITGENYDEAIHSIVNFSNQYGLALKNADFNNFKKEMISKNDFTL